MASRLPPASDTAARWPTCDRACHATLRWPVRLTSEAAGEGPQPPLPDVPAPAHSLLACCGESGLRRLVDRHMARLRYTPLLAHAGDCYGCVVDRVADYVIEACGGPLYYSRRHARLQAGAGLPVLLDAPGRELWLVQLWHALEDLGLPEPLRADYWSWAEAWSLQLLAPHARRVAPRRYPFALVQSWFADDALAMSAERVH